MCDGSTNTKLEPVCERPLGLKFNSATCDLYIADAYYGLLVVGPDGGVATQLAASAEGVPFRFMNALDVDSRTGMVYFTDNSIYFQRREYLLAIINADRTGRLMKYDPNSKKVTVLLKGLAFPNGVALSKDNSFILVAESFTMRILKFHLVGSEIHGQEIFIQLGRFPDNIKRTANGEFWVALNTGRGKIRRLESTKLQQETSIDWFADDPVAVRLTSGGEVVNVLDGNGGNALDSVSEVEEYSGFLWLGSSMKPYVGYIENKK
ncbi:PREDICTED: strictosidine synthase 1-like [Populus euphratica]|uniref:Strictosidine synthase 1-like n=1 Tax=Populus euphratica TaxID=75702 RepID=A0AAJ6TSV4_POPEU|nr:PREDICTED: strictosidine synthase 1-like [Populus euphratica]